MTRATTALAACLLVAVQAEAADFTVPQGGGRLPTIAIVECLAAEGSRVAGQYCRTTYQCSPKRDGTEVSGTLWEGMTHHNGRLVTSGEDPIATERSCVLAVEDDAKATFYHGYRPDGKGGGIAGFTRIGSAASTVTMGSFTFSPDNMLAQFLSHNAVRAATLDDWIERVCGGVEEENDQERCRRRNDDAGFYIEGIGATDRTACYIEALIRYDIVSNNATQRNWLPFIVGDWSGQRWEKCN